jgi:predicted transcriptional regulator
MPGGRLTLDDRKQVAAWLAEGLGYAEIARRLGRPTSTISREVARNSASGVYLADRAQHVAGHRARRRRSVGFTEPATGDERVREFVDRFATVLASTGLPRMTARVFVCLVTADENGLTAADLVATLRVSPASVSKAIAFLESMDLVVRQQNPGARRERYLVDDDVWLRAWQTDTGAHGAVAAAAAQGIEILGADTVAGERLHRMGQFFGLLSERMTVSPISQSIVDDARTVLAAFVHAGRPLTIDTLAAALDWPRDRVREAVEAIRVKPDPFVLHVKDGAYRLGASPDRLSASQRGTLELPTGYAERL